MAKKINARTTTLATSHVPMLSRPKEVAAVIIAGVFLAYSEGAQVLAWRIGRRIGGERGAALVDLGGATMRSVARGVLGVAIIQSSLAGVGYFAVGLPAAGLWTLASLVLAVLQIGVGPVLIGAVIYEFAKSDMLTAILFLAWCIFVSVIDNILRPLLLGRGVDVPLVVIFMGAIGGMLASGIIGLFVGDWSQTAITVVLLAAGWLVLSRLHVTGLSFLLALALAVQLVFATVTEATVHPCPSITCCWPGVRLSAAGGAPASGASNAIT